MDNKNLSPEEERLRDKERIKALEEELEKLKNESTPEEERMKAIAEKAVKKYETDKWRGGLLALAISFVVFLIMRGCTG